MTTISKIEIKNLYGKGKFAWELNPIVNILGGKNGSGKSSIFKACHILLSDDIISQEEDKAMSNAAVGITITLSNNWTLSWPSAADGLVLATSGILGRETKEACVCKDADGVEISYADFKTQLDSYFINSFEQHLSTAEAYVKSPRVLGDADPTLLDLLIKEQIEQRNKDFSVVMEKYVDDTEEDIRQRSQYLKSYKRIYTAIKHFLSGYEGDINSTFTFVRNGNSFSYEYLSMGEKQILLLLLMVSNTHNKPCVFFMDEPDLSMHIDWKEILVKELHTLNPNMQIILSTHAPSVITGWVDCVREVDQLIEK